MRFNSAHGGMCRGQDIYVLGCEGRLHGSMQLPKFAILNECINLNYNKCNHVALLAFCPVHHKETFVYSDRNIH